MKKGFTLPEILAAVMIVAILVTMAVPMYERAIEKSRLAEVTATLKSLGESKTRWMDDASIGEFLLAHCQKASLDVSVNSKEFAYSFYPDAKNPNAVCAKRLKGDNAGTLFLYLGDTAHESCAGNWHPACQKYRTSRTKLFCKGNCEPYGMESTDFGTCNTSAVCQP